MEGTHERVSVQFRTKSSLQAKVESTNQQNPRLPRPLIGNHSTQSGHVLVTTGGKRGKMAFRCGSQSMRTIASACSVAERVGIAHLGPQRDRVDSPQRRNYVGYLRDKMKPFAGKKVTESMKKAPIDFDILIWPHSIL
jgi:hypothetical protein